MTESTEEDIERIASRLAMVVSEDGEAANAGRAIGHLARRIGLTGGDLKQMFMAGAAQGQHARAERASTGEVDRLQREGTTLRASLRLSESNLRLLERERDALQYEIAALRTTLERRRSSGWLRTFLTVAVAVALVVTVAIGFLRHELFDPEAPAPRTAAVPSIPRRAGPQVGIAEGGPARSGVVHSGQAQVFVQPDRAAPVLATLHAGTAIVVHRLLWNMLVQWAEIDVGSGTGYVLTTDIDLT